MTNYFPFDGLPTRQAYITTVQDQILIDANNYFKFVVAKVENCKEGGIQEFRGSCFLFSNTFHLLTCAHVVSSQYDRLQVTFPEFSVTLDAVCIHADTEIDLAVLKILLPEGHSPTHNLPYLKIAPECIAGMNSYCAGFVQNELQVTNGIVTHSKDPCMFVVTNITDHGVSGGPCSGRGFTNLFGVVRADFGIAHHRTEVIPYHIVLHYLKRVHAENPSVPMIEIFKD